MQESDGGTLTKVLMFVGGLVTAALAALTKVIIDRKKTNAEAVNISTTTELEVRKLTLEEIREYRELFTQAEMEIRKSRRHWMNAEFLIREMLYAMKISKIEGWEQYQAKFDDMMREMS